MEREIEALLGRWAHVKEDVRVCHEYYCRNNCHTLMWDGKGEWPHTLRCKRLRQEFGFLAYPREVELPEDIVPSKNPDSAKGERS